ncbi:uncharacterized protein LOC121874829 [Homarus americanus]|uniref:Uncharacterized protein n=1 Tax=Homarus americanus TaxID=6706 RepID=A0A8J5JPH9_HOMAM|nr:uncharacterized protein LOC121874829 [Homarus americanus]KAG7161611.1 hypothetical protein Hamer_G014178 [Homarus americanus]
MKCFLVLLSLCALAWGQEEHLCGCGAFANTPEGEIMIDELPPIEIANCEEGNRCQLVCSEEWLKYTNDGDLNLLVGNITLGQEMCDGLERLGFNDFAPQEITLYYNVCEGPWETNGLATDDDLCCVNGVFPGEC